MGRLNRKLMGSPHCLSMSPNKVPAPAVSRKMKATPVMKSLISRFTAFPIIQTYKIIYTRTKDMQVKVEATVVLACEWEWKLAWAWA